MTSTPGAEMVALERAAEMNQNFPKTLLALVVLFCFVFMSALFKKIGQSTHNVMLVSHVQQSDSTSPSVLLRSPRVQVPCVALGHSYGTVTVLLVLYS